MDTNGVPNLSELYAKDCPDFVLLFNIASTTKRPAKGDERYRNTSKYLIDDYSTNSDEADQKSSTMSCFKILSQFTGTVKVCDPPANYPPQSLLQHWADKFHDGVPIKIIKTELDDQRPHVLKIPLEKLPKECHAVDPDAHYEVYSKRFIGTIECPQAKILDKSALVYPCVFKLCVSSSARGVWIINNKNEYIERLQHIHDTLPNADYILTEYVDNVAKNYTIHFYLNTAGEYTLFGGAEQRFTNNGIFGGCVYYHENQQEVREFVLKGLIPVIEAMHRKGYFGYLSVDVLVDANGNLFVVDINPRWGGSAAAILGTANTMARKGYAVSMYIMGLEFEGFKGPLESLFGVLNTIQGGEVVVLDSYGSNDMMCKSSVVIYAPTYDECCRIEEECRILGQ